MKKIVLFIIIVLSLIGGFKLIKQKKEEIANESTAFVHTYKSLESGQENGKDDFEHYSATLEAMQNPKISTKISGHITKLLVKENQEVKVGDPILFIDDMEYKENMLQINYAIKALEASIESFEVSLHSLQLDMQLSQREFETNTKLYKIGGIAKDKLDFSKIIYEQKKAKYDATLKTIQSKKNELISQQSFLNSKKKLQGYYELNSPIDGFIEEVFVEIGEIASLNKTLVSLVSSEQKLSFLFANDTIKVGQEVFVNKEKIGVIDSVSVSAKNYMKEANILLNTQLKYPNNSLVSIEVKIK